MPGRMPEGKVAWASLAEYCHAVEEFREKTKAVAHGRISDLVRELDELIWEKKLGGRVPRLWFDSFACDYATELIAIPGAYRTSVCGKRSNGSRRWTLTICSHGRSSFWRITPKSCAGPRTVTASSW